MPTSKNNHEAISNLEKPVEKKTIEKNCTLTKTTDYKKQKEKEKQRLKYLKRKRSESENDKQSRLK